MSIFELLFYIFTGSLAISYMVYGKKQGKAIAFLSGLGLGIIPYFGLEMWQMIVTAVLLMGFPFLMKV